MPETESAPFRRAVVALNGGPSDARIVRLVAAQAARTKAELIAVHVVEIDWTLPLDADIAGRSEEVQQVLDTAEAIAESYKLTLEPVLLQARDVGAAIVDEATKGADIVMTSLPMPRDVEAVTLGDNGILANIGKGQTYIDLSTNAPSMVKKIGAAFTGKGIAMLDAPVSGGTTGAEAATIAIMVGGDKKVFDDALPVLQSFSANVIHMGGLGSGTVAKLCNNMLS
ncbi:MAG: NAD(P)-binding domain-containing protein, partial [Candidatus Limnocylindrales bacterium]